MKLQYNQGGSTDTINLVDYKPSMHRLAIQKNGQTYYAKLGEVNHPEATNIKVRRNGKNFAAIKKYDSRSFEEIGNVSVEIYSAEVNSVIKEGFGRGIYMPNNTGYVKLSNLSLGGQNFTLEVFMLMETIPPLNSRLFGLYQNNLWSGLAVGTYESALYLSCRAGNTVGSTQLKTLPRNNWFHFELDYVQSTGAHYYFIDGVPKVSFTAKRTRDPATIQISGSSIHALELRISDDIARHTSAFTPPTKPYEVDQYTVALLHF